MFFKQLQTHQPLETPPNDCISWKNNKAGDNPTETKKYKVSVDVTVIYLPLNRIQGKSMLKNKSPQIARECMSSYIGYLRDERIIAHVIVERVSNMKRKQRKQLTTT